MNNMKRHVENGYEIKEIVRKKLKYGSGYVIIDRGDNKIYVDTKRGLTAQLILIVDDGGNKHISYRWYNKEGQSSKDNGYYYTPIIIEDNNGKLKMIPYSTHNLILMIEDEDRYDEIVNCDNIPIGNHKNNRPWDNRYENLEWVTIGENNKHSKIVGSIHKYYEGIYTHIENNCGNNEFVILDYPFSVNDITNFMSYADDYEYFRCKIKEHIGYEKITNFIKWLINNKDWEDCVGW